MRNITHGDPVTVPIEGFDGTATLRRRYTDDTMEVTLSTAPGILFRLEESRERPYTFAIFIEGGDLDGSPLVELRAWVERSGTLFYRRRVAPYQHEYYDTVQQAIADVWPAFSKRALAELAAEEAEGVPA